MRGDLFTMAFFSWIRSRGPQHDSAHRTVKAASHLVAIAIDSWGFLRFLASLAFISLMLVVVLEIGRQPSEPEPEPKSKASAVLRSGRATVRSLAWAPDGTTLAAGDRDGQVALWDIGEGQVQAVFPAPEDPHAAGEWVTPVPLAWAPDGTTLASSQGPEVILRDVAERRTRASFRVAAPPIKSLAFSPDGADLAAGCGDGSVVIWDLRADRIRATLRGNKGNVNGLAFSPDGRTLASLSVDGTLCAWDVATGRPRWAAMSPWGGCSVAFATDGVTIATCGTHLTLWDSASGRARRDLDRDLSSYNAITYSPDGRWLAAISPLRGTITLWESTGLRRRASFQGRIAPGYSLAFAPDGRTLATGGQDGTIELWPVADIIGQGSRPPDGAQG
jgi:WD40 repeat protein